LSDEFKTLREGFRPASEEEGKAAIRETSSSSAEDRTGGEGENNCNHPDNKAQTKAKDGRPKTDWNNVLEDNPVKEKLPPKRSTQQQNDNGDSVISGNSLITGAKNAEQVHIPDHLNEDTLDADYDNPGNNVNTKTTVNDDPLSRGKISFTATYSTEDSSTMSKEALDEWYQNEFKKIKPLDPSYFEFSGYRCYYCEDFETDNSKHGKRNYEIHLKSKHGDDPDHPCYPSKADLERLQLKPQRKRWEI
jgi:hypothetical protein